MAGRSACCRVPSVASAADREYARETPDLGTAVIQNFLQGVMTIDSGIGTLLSLDEELPGGGSEVSPT